MADPPSFIRFKRAGDPPPAGPASSDRVPLYELALQFAARVYAVIELAELERYFLRDQLDRKSALVPQVIAQGLATADMAARRELYQRARQALIDCRAILDMLGERGTVEPEPLAAAIALAHALSDQLQPLIVAPSRVW